MSHLSSTFYVSIKGQYSPHLPAFCLLLNLLPGFPSVFHLSFYHSSHSLFWSPSFSSTIRFPSQSNLGDILISFPQYTTNTTPSLPFNLRLNTTLIGFVIHVFVGYSIGSEYPQAGVMEWEPTCEKILTAHATPWDSFHGKI